ncbi:MAG: YhgE/Pip family protein [Blautia sp.]
MKTIFRIFFRDVRRLSRNFVAIIVIIGISLIPALYAWFNIAANFDPYGNTGNVKVAVANNDVGYQSALLDLNAGDEIIQNLKDNSQLGWTFTSEKKAIEGVRSGKYYSAIIIPEKFSANMASILSGDIQQPKIRYYVNEKKNAIAPKITDTGASTLQSEVNSTFSEIVARTVSDTLNSAAGDLYDDTNSLTGSITTSLQKMEDNLEDYQVAIEKFNQLSTQTRQTVQNQRQALPEAQKTISSGKTALADAQELLSEGRDSTSSLLGIMGSSVDQSVSLFHDLNQSASSALSQIEGDSLVAAGQAESAQNSAQDVLDISNECIGLLTNLNDSLPQPITAVTDLLTELTAQTERQQGVVDNLNETCDAIRATAETSNNTRGNLSDLAQQGSQQLGDLRSSLQNDVGPQLGNSVDHLSQTSGDLSGLLTTVEASVSNLAAILEEVDQSLSSIETAMDSTSDTLSLVQTKLEKTQTEISAVSNSERYQEILSFLKSDPEKTSHFMSSPVQLETKTYYGIATYGSGISALYTNLAIWVGGIVLIAILKLDVKEDQTFRHLSPTVSYFSRYLLFMVIGLLQALIVCLGDLYLIHIQCRAPVRFVMAGLMCSFIYVNIIYALSITWRHIGKALAVLLLVIQIPGSAGSYPIEVTPEFFQILHPFLPFTYGVNAMRETIGGVYGNAYASDLLHLLLFLPIALFIGLVLRKPLMSLNNFFDRRLSETHFM